MKRFEGLEFDSPDPESELPLQPVEPDHDEHYWLRVADSERREGYAENALRYYSRALESNKSIVQGWVGQVQMLIALGEFIEAELWARKALELFRNNGDLAAGRAHAMTRLGNLVEALPLSDASFRQEGMGAYRWMVRGEIMLARGEELDQHCFDKAIGLDSDWLVLIEIAQIYRYRRKSAKGVILTRRAVERAPQASYAWYVQGCLEAEMGLITAAHKSFSQCLMFKPGHLEARRALDSMDAERWSLTGHLRRFFRIRKNV